MGLLSAFVEKTYFYPLNHRPAGDTEDLCFQARGNCFYPLIKDGDILHIQHMGGSALQIGDLALVKRPRGVFALQLVLRKTPCDERPAVKTEGVMLHASEEAASEERLFGRIAAIDRERGTKRCNHRLARLSHMIYFGARPWIMIFLCIRKILSLFHPRFFVGDPESSLRCVAEKFNEDDEVVYHSQRAFEGLDEHEQYLVEQFMRRRGKVLNIGCGAGREAFAFAELGFEIVGIDFAPQMIAAARRHAPSDGKSIRFEVKSATDLDYPPDSFNYVFMGGGVYSLIPTRELRIDTLKKIGELLTPNGTLFFSAFYRRGSVLSRVSLYSAFRRVGKLFLKGRLHAEPGDILVRYVSPVGRPSNLCFLHLFKDAGEVLEEVSSAGLEGFEDKESGYWVVKPCREGEEHDPGQIPEVHETVSGSW